MAKSSCRRNGKARLRGVQNDAYAEGMRRIRGGNAAGSHDSRPNRQRSRQDAKRASLRDQA